VFCDERRLQVKTKAKLRYLRRKKERRKQRKVSAPKSAPKSRQSVAGSVGQEPEESAEEGSEEDVHQSSEESATEEVQVDDPESAKDKIKPRKRRKLAQSVQPEDHLQTISPSEVNKHSPQRTFDALPSFPPPVLPNLPSKHDLVLQGVDQGLLDAEIVDAATLLPISAEGEEDSATGLSQRTRRRLVELGINELFAGQSYAHPHRLLISKVD
jgi:ATP-dependent RNA helicase DDX51/DBP6